MLCPTLTLAAQERMSSAPVLSRTSSSSSSMGGSGGPSGSLQLQLVDDPIPGGFEAASQQPLKRLDFVRTQGGFWLTWVRSTAGLVPVWRTPQLSTAMRACPHSFSSY